MKITRIRVRNFKSLVDFDLKLVPFTCLVGMNGVGKSTVLQVLDFIAQQFKGDIAGWLEMRQWDASDLNSRLTRRSNIDLGVELSYQGAPLRWEASFNRVSMHCTSETISLDGHLLFRVRDGRYKIREENEMDISFDYQGSILSQLRESQLIDCLIEFKNFFTQMESLDLISPELLRTKTREAKGQLGLGGQNLSAFLSELDEEKRSKLLSGLTSVYPQLDNFSITSLRSGWKRLSIEERFGDHLLKSNARHVNDGMLRMMAVLSQLFSDHSFLLFDEIENGMNPELVEFLMNTLVASDKQVLVTTHSPMILNYLDDEVAKAGVAYLYKTAEGFTKSIAFFDIPSLAEKLTVMGPGEVFVDTDLTKLADEISRITQQ